MKRYPTYLLQFNHCPRVFGISSFYAIYVPDSLISIYVYEICSLIFRVSWIFPFLCLVASRTCSCCRDPCLSIPCWAIGRAMTATAQEVAWSVVDPTRGDLRGHLLTVLCLEASILCPAHYLEKKIVIWYI